MAVYTPPSTDEIIQRIVARVVSRVERLSDLRPGGELSQFIVSFSKELRAAFDDVATLRDARIPSRMVGQDLDDYGREILPDGVTRRGARRATSYAVFSRVGTSGGVAIPAGFVVGRSDGKTYQTTAASSIADGDTESDPTPIIAQEAGSASNAAAGAITRVISTSPSGLSATNTVAAADGEDRESDADFLAQQIAYPRTLSRANPTAVSARALQAVAADGTAVRFAKTVPGESLSTALLVIDDGTGSLEGAYATAPGETLTAAAVGGEFLLYVSKWPVRTKPTVYKDAVELVEGTDYTFSRPNGQVRLLVPATAGEEYTTGTYTHWTGLVAEANRLVYGDAANLIEFPAYAGVGGELLLTGARSTLAALTISVLVRPGYDSDTVTANVVSVVVQFINRLGIGEPMYLSAVIAVAHAVPGVMSVTITTPVDDLYPAVDGVIRTNAASVAVGS